MPGTITSQIRRRPAKKLTTHTPMVRQWQLLEWLSADSKGITVAEAAEVFGVDIKTIRRDLTLLGRLGFDLTAIEEETGRKRWRIRRLFERLRSKRQKYRSILDLVEAACEQVEAVGDQRLARDLEALRRRVARRCK